MSVKVSIIVPVYNSAKTLRRCADSILNQDFTDWIEYKHQEQFLFWDGLAYVKFNNKYGYINHKGEVVIPIIYDKADNFYNGKATVVLNGKNIIIDRI